MSKRHIITGMTLKGNTQREGALRVSKHPIVFQCERMHRQHQSVCRRDNYISLVLFTNTDALIQNYRNCEEVGEDRTKIITRDETCS